MRPSGPDQADLFGAPEPPSTPDRVAPAAIPPAVADLAARIPAAIRMGTSSWTFPGWRGQVYREDAPARALASHGLAAYGAHPALRAVGLDRTWHQPMPADAFAHLAAQVPDDFRFVVKLHAASTSPRTPGPPSADRGPNPLFLDPAFARDSVVEPAMAGLGARLGVVLVQFPPLPDSIVADPAGFAAALVDFVTALPAGPVYAVEPRNRGILGGHYARALRACAAVHCLNGHPTMPPLAAQLERWSPRPGLPLMVRWSLGGTAGYEAMRQHYAPFSRVVDPDPATRAAIARACLAQTAAGGESLVIVNNKAEGCAPGTVLGIAAALVAALDDEAGEQGTCAVAARSN